MKEERKQKILDWASMVLDGMSLSEVARQNNVSRQYVHQELSLISNSKVKAEDKYKAVDQQSIIKDYLQGDRINDIIAKYKVPREMVKRVFTENNIVKESKQTERIKQMEVDWANGLKLKEIAEKQGLTLGGTVNLMSNARRLGFNFPKKVIGLCVCHASARQNGIYLVTDKCPHPIQGTKGKKYQTMEWCKMCPSKIFYN